MFKTARLMLALAIGLILVMPALAQNQDIKLSGSHFNLNLLGKEDGKCPGDDLKGTNRHNIMVLLNFSDNPQPNEYFGDGDVLFVDLDKRNKIFLTGGDDFQVTDGNACDGDGAAFTLPSDIASAYQIYVRELAKPGGTGSLTTCAVDEQTDEVVCSMNSVSLSRVGKKPVWRNVTKELTTLDYYYWDGDSWEETSVTLFEQPFEQYFWDYDNNGLRLVQLRFYPIVN
jgi:hypothetical protein